MLNDLSPLQGVTLISETNTIIDYINNLKIVSVLNNGVTGNGTTDDSTAFNACAAANPNTVLSLPPGSYLLNNVQLVNNSLQGYGFSSIIIPKNGSTAALYLGWTNTPSAFSYRKLDNIVFNGQSNSVTGVSFTNASSPEISGRWNISNCTFINCNIGVLKPEGNFGNTFQNVEFSTNNFGYHATGSASPLMQVGNDTFIGCDFDGNALAAIYINSSINSNYGSAIRNTIIENNAGFGIFVLNYGGCLTPLLIDQVTFENNATAGSVTIDAVSYTPKDIYLANTEAAILSNGVVPNIQLVNSNLMIQNCCLNSTISQYNIDSTSTVTADNVYIQGGQHPVVVNSISNVIVPLGGNAATFKVPCRQLISGDRTNAISSITYATADTYSFPGTGTITGHSIADGRIFDSCCNLTIPAGYSNVSPNITFTSGDWYVITGDFKLISGIQADLVITISGGSVAVPNLAPLLIAGEWVTVGCVANCTSTVTLSWLYQNTSGGNIVLNISALQVVQFSTQEQAVAYYNSRQYNCLVYPRRTYSTTIPTTGTWALGDEVYNATPTSGGFIGWVCTVAGTPGTWAVFGQSGGIATTSNIYLANPSSTIPLPPSLVPDVSIYPLSSTSATVWTSGQNRIMAVISNPSGLNLITGVLNLSFFIPATSNVFINISLAVSSNAGANASTSLSVLSYYGHGDASVVTLSAFLANFQLGSAIALTGSQPPIIWLTKNVSITGETGFYLNSNFSGNGSYYNEGTPLVGQLLSSYTGGTQLSASITPTIVTTQTSAIAPSGTWVPVLNSFTQAGGSATVTGTYVISGGIFYGTCKIVPVTSTSCVFGTGNITGLPITPTQQGALVSSYGTAIYAGGEVSSASSGLIYPASWTAVTATVYVSFQYQIV